jgi:inner membrane protein
MVAFSLLSMLPDADVIGFPLGIRYEDPWGHRGASHSIVFALLVTAALTAVLRRAGFPPLRTAVTAGLVLLSHGLLDTLTDGGLGCALLWPFSDARFFAPVTPLPVAPLGHYMFSLRGVLVLTVELFAFAPFLLYATFPRRSAAPSR